MIYILFSDLSIGTIKSICNCGKCKERGQVEIFIDELNGEYKDCIKFSDLFDKREVIAISENLEALKEMQPIINNSGNTVAIFLQQKLLEE